MKLLISRRLPAAVITRAQSLFDVTYRDEPVKGLSEAEVSAALESYDAMLVSLGDAMTAKALADAKAPKCKLVANFGVGYNHIDAAAYKAAGIAVTNTPGAVTDATADIAMTLMLMAARRAGEGERLVRSGAWQGWGPTETLGQHITGKTVGIVGMGRIGQAIAKRCHFGFDMDVLYYNRSAKDVPYARRVADLHALMGASDVVMVAVPGGNPDLIGEAELAAMKPTGVLVNIARGDVVSESALIEALAQKRIAAAGLDVYVNEPLVAEALRTLENAVLLPHLGTSTLEVREEIGFLALSNVEAFAKGEALVSPV